MSDRTRWRLTQVILAPVLPFIRGSRVHQAYEWEREWRSRCIQPFGGDPLPALPEQRTDDIYVWGIIDWAFRQQRPQHLASGLARRGHRVFYVSPTFVRARRPGFELERIEVRGAPCVYNVRLHLDSRPRIYAGTPRPEDTSKLQEGLAHLLDWTGGRRAVSVVQHPYWHALARAVPGGRLVYDCMDHHQGFAETGAGIDALEAQLLHEADAVVASSQGLHDAARARNDNVALVRNGAEYAHFAAAPPDAFRDAQGRRVIGYYGAIAEWIDVALLRQVAERFPDCLLLLIGADTAGARAALAGLANVELIGEVPYAALPRYLHGMDVCLLPFRVLPLTLATNPVKVYEYLAAGKPVAAIELPELQQFDGLIRLARSPEGFLDAVAALLADPGTEAMPARRAFAARNTWDDRVAAFSQVLASLPEPAVSVVVVTYNNLALTRACLDSLERDTDYGNFETIVVDNASSDGTPDALRAWQAAGPRRRIVLNADNRGFAAANNQGLALAVGDYLVMLNNDTEVTPGWLRTLVNHLRRDASLGMVGPVTDNIGNEARIEMRYRDGAEMRRKAAAYVRRHMGRLLPMRTLAFFCAVLPRRVYQAIGPLDEAFGLGFFEDDDYCRRIEQAGLKLACAEDAFIHHHLSASFNKLGKGRQELLDRNRAIYEAKWGPWTPHRQR